MKHYLTVARSLLLDLIKDLLNLIFVVKIKSRDVSADDA